MPDAPAAPGRLLAISDLHVSYPRNRQWVEDMPPGAPGDWLLVVGDVAEKVADIEWALRTLSRRFGTVVWVPGNHELWSHPSDPVQLRGEERYQHLVARCRELSVITPEDPYPVWPGAGGPAVIVPLFLLYDYTFRPDGASNKAEALALAYASGLVGTDETLLASRSVPQPGGMVPGADRRDHAAPDGPGPPDADHPGQPLSPHPRAHQDPALPRVRPVVRHRADSRLAPAVPRSRGGLRAPAHPAGPSGRTGCGSRRCRSAIPRSRTGTRTARAS